MEDTICAVSTAPGAGGIAVIRISGPEAIAICNTIFVPRTAGKGLLSQKAYTLRYGSIRRGEELIDEVLIALFRAPHSFTGEDTVEITCHGSVYIQQQIMQLLIERGCRSALPGEYTQRAFMNGKMDLSQAEAVADLIASTSAGQHRLALNQMRGGFSHELKNLREQLLHITSLMELELDFSKLGAWHTAYNPLHILDTMQIVPTENDHFIRRQLLRGYVHDEAAAFQGGVSGNAGLFSNANDLAKVLQLYLNQGSYGGEQYLTKETCRLFTQSKSPTCRRGLGFDKPVAGGGKASPCGSLAPASVYGHTGFTGTCFWVDPDNNLLYIFLSNRVNPTRANNKLGSLDIRTRIQDAIYKAIK